MLDAPEHTRSGRTTTDKKNGRRKERVFMFLTYYPHQ